MNHPDFTSLRRHIDEAITFNDMASAREHARLGLLLAEQKENVAELMYFRAQMEIIDERFAEALIFLKKAVEANPKDGAAYNDMALCLIEMGHIEGMIELFDKGIEVEPDYATIHHNKGWFLNKLGQHQQSLESFYKALALEPDRVVTYENLANVYENLGRVKDALAAYEQALRLTRSDLGVIREQIKGQIERLEKGMESGND